MEDRQIIKLIKAKDEQGLNALLDRYGAFIRYVIRGILEDYPQDCEECFNDICYKLWWGLQDYDETRASLKNYIACIARNAAIDTIRKLNRQAMKKESHARALQELFLQQSMAKSAEEEVLLRLKSDREEKLLQALEKLRKTEKEIIIRKYFYLQSVSRIAEELECTEKSVEGKLARIRKKLKKTMEKM